MLTDTQLSYANLLGANLRLARLNGANLTEANLEGTDLRGARFDERTILPDGKNYIPNVTDMSIFTNWKHPMFWRSDDPASPAWRGKEE